MTRADLEHAIQRVIDAERYADKIVEHPLGTRGDLINARREVRDARVELDGLLGVLDQELAFTPRDFDPNESFADLAK